MPRDQVPLWINLGCRVRAFLGAALERDGLPDYSVLYTLSTGTTTTTGIAASATSPRHSATPDRMTGCWLPATRSTKQRAHAIHNAGVGGPATGHRLAPSPSIRSVTSWFGRPPHKSSFPVRSASLLSGPDLAAPKPRRATQGMGGAEPPGATRSALYRA